MRKSKSRKLMIVAHPDDETLFGGGLLLSKDWTVICVTGGDNPVRRKEFLSVMKEVDADCEIWSYPDVWEGHFNMSLLSKELVRVIRGRRWDMIVTHNSEGEYGHTQHKALFSIVSSLVKTGLWVFKYPVGKLWQLDPKVVEKKRELLQMYKSRLPGFEMFQDDIAFESIVRVK